jgi:hypothetical protein
VAYAASAEMQAFNQQKATLFPAVSAELVTELTPTKKLMPQHQLEGKQHL